MACLSICLVLGTGMQEILWRRKRVCDHPHVCFGSCQFVLLACPLQCSYIHHSLQQLRVLLLVLLVVLKWLCYLCPVRHRHVEHLWNCLILKLVLCLDEWLDSNLQLKVEETELGLEVDGAVFPCLLASESLSFYILHCIRLAYLLINLEDRSCTFSIAVVQKL